LFAFLLSGLISLLVAPLVRRIFARLIHWQH